MGSQEIIDEIRGSSVRITDQLEREHTFDINELCLIDDTDVSGEFMRQPALYAYFATLQANAEKRLLDAKANTKKEYALADLAAREELSLNSQKYTESVISAMIQADERYVNAVSEENLAEYDAKLLKAICYALEQRANMLISLGSQIRHEANMTGMSVKDVQLDNAIQNAKNVMKSRQK